jgi:hypothetical protein
VREKMKKRDREKGSTKRKRNVHRNVERAKHIHRKSEESEALTESRVTRLGEYSPNGRLFTLGQFLKTTEAVHIFVLLLS